MTAPTYKRSRLAIWHSTSRRTLVNPNAHAGTLELENIPALVWEALAEPQTLDGIVDDLADVFAQPAACIREDVRELLTRMVAAGLVES